MALESIKAVKQAEDEANDAIQKALMQSKEMSKRADSKAMEIYKNSMNTAKQETARILADAQLQGENEAEPILKEGGSDVEKILNIDQAKIDEAVILVTGRIVRKNGNN